MPFRNIETHFSQAPQAKFKRSVFKYNLPNKFTFNAGDLVPFMVEEVLPGDTFDLKLSKVVRLTTSIHPTMDNLYLDTYFFFVPNRFAWDNWQKFMGENDKAWTDTTVYVPPKIKFGGLAATSGSSYRYGFVRPQSIFNYLFVPSFTDDEVKEFEVNAMPFNCYIKIFNDWFRSENLLDEVPYYKGDGLIPLSYLNAYETLLSNDLVGATTYLFDSNSCLKVAKFADYFTRALPQPQKGADVLIPAGGDVIFNPDGYDSNNPPRFLNVEGMNDGTDSSGVANLFNNPVGATYEGTASDPDDWRVQQFSAQTTARGKDLGYDPQGTLSLAGLEITVNNLRLAMQTQRLLERDARAGTRYIELVRAHFGVVSPDLRLQRSEYLGGKRTLINMSEVIQTSETTSNSPLGNLAGRSITTGTEDSFIKSFTEHGYIIGLCCVRPDRTYSQGVHRRNFRFSRLDYYFTVLANIGEQPIYEREIFLPKKNESINPDDVFGYQEAWSEYRTQQGMLKGFMQPGITGSLSSWTYADYYTSSPVLSSLWLYQGKSEIDNTLAVPSNVAPQFIADFLVYGKAVRTMPVYSIPGLIDHN